MDGLSLTNPEFPFSFNGKDYSVKKANLQQFMMWQRKVKEVKESSDAAGDVLVVAYAIFLILNAVDKNVSEQYVLENCPAAIDIAGLFTQLGFIYQQKTA